MVERDLELHIRCDSPTPRAVRCHHRIAHQALDFASLDMCPAGDGYSAVIPGHAIDPAWDLMARLAYSDALFRHQDGVTPNA